MYIDKNVQNHSEAITKLAYESYKKQIETHPGIFLKMYEEYSVFMKQELSAINGLVCMEDEVCLGYLIYNSWEENGEIYCRIPEWGYGAIEEKREKIISRLFQELADELVGEKTVHFSMNASVKFMQMKPASCFRHNAGWIFMIIHLPRCPCQWILSVGFHWPQYYSQSDCRHSCPYPQQQTSRFHQMESAGTVSSDPSAWG